MENIFNFNAGVVAEWMSLIDPQGSDDRNLDEKINAIVQSQAAMLLNSDLNQVRTKYWILTKTEEPDGTTQLEFTLLAYVSRTTVTSLTPQQFEARKIKLLRDNLEKAIAKEDYIKAAQLRDELARMDSEDRQSAA